MALTIYERHGGFPKVRKVVSSFYDRVLESPLIAHRFKQIDMRRLIDHQTRFISFLMGGPASYTDEHLQHVHQRLGITHEELDEMVELLTETLEDFEFSRSDIAHIVNELRRRESRIVAQG